MLMLAHINPKPNCPIAALNLPQPFAYFTFNPKPAKYCESLVRHGGVPHLCRNRSQSPVEDKLRVQTCDRVSERAVKSIGVHSKMKRALSRA